MKKLLVFVFAVTLLGSCGKKGCTDPLADNYDADATIDNGSCEYPDTTYIPDPNFEQALISLGYDDVIDEQVLTSNINSIFHLDVRNENISDLTGIKDFTSLVSLDCAYNKLISLDVSQNTALRALQCESNQLTSLDVSQNTALRSLICRANQLNSLDVSGCNALTSLECESNQLTSLDVSQNTALERLGCESNQLTSLDVSQNTALNRFYCYMNQLECLNIKNGNNTNFLWFGAFSNPNLTCIEVDDPNWATSNWPANGSINGVDNGVTFSTNCNYPAGCF